MSKWAGSLCVVYIRDEWTRRQTKKQISYDLLVYDLWDINLHVKWCSKWWQFFWRNILTREQEQVSFPRLQCLSIRSVRVHRNMRRVLFWHSSVEANEKTNNFGTIFRRSNWTPIRDTLSLNSCDFYSIWLSSVRGFWPPLTTAESKRKQKAHTAQSASQHRHRTSTITCICLTPRPTADVENVSNWWNNKKFAAKAEEEKSNSAHLLQAAKSGFV